VLDPFLVRLLIGVLVYFLLDLVIKTLITKPESQRVFEIILLICVVLYVFFGSFLPLR
jgi:predicted PurR-regulated permease PerM